jgi:Holliday junction resolvase RusA-like endonuclease
MASAAPWDEPATSGTVAAVFSLVHAVRPVPQGRPRAINVRGKSIVMKASNSRAYENGLADAARNRALEINWAVPSPQARLELLVDVYRAADQGDLDNFVKAVSDALTSAGVWVDDRRVVRIVANMSVDRAYPRVELQVRALP